MSRGLGDLQRRALDAMRCDKALHTMEIAAITYGATVTLSEREALRRALRSLVSRGLLFDVGGWPKRYGTKKVAEESTHREILIFMYTTWAGRWEVKRQLGLVDFNHFPTLKEWLSVGNCGNCIKCQGEGGK